MEQKEVIIPIPEGGINNNLYVHLRCHKGLFPHKWGIDLAKSVTLKMSWKVILHPDLWIIPLKYAWLKYRLSCFNCEVVKNGER
jgi:hypothetical protein